MVEGLRGEIHTPVGGYTNIVCISKKAVVSYLSDKTE